MIVIMIRATFFKLKIDNKRIKNVFFFILSSFVEKMRNVKLHQLVFGI